MARPRNDLHAILVGILGSPHVYFQPPTNTNMKFPCIVYVRNDEDVKHANGQVYLSMQGYTVTVIDGDPDSLTPSKVRALPYTKFSRHFKADSLNHDAFNLFF